MKIELGDILLTDDHPTDYCKLNSDYVCLVIGRDMVSVNIDVLIKALQLMKERE